MHSSTIFTALRLFVIMTILTGVMYPAMVTIAGYAAFPQQACGSIIKKNSTAIGSLLIAQSPPDTGYFLPRPSAGNYATTPSAASNYALSSVALHDIVLQRSAKYGKPIGQLPSDLVFSSGSGLDPHISPEAARFQADRIARVRGLSGKEVDELDAMIDNHTEKPQFGILGDARVNVLLLNIDLDNIKFTAIE